MRRHLLAGVVVALIAAVSVATASAGLHGSGSISRASGFTLYEYDYSVEFNKPTKWFTFAFKSFDKITSVTAPPGFSKCVVNRAAAFFRCLGHAAANTVISGTFYVRQPLPLGEGATLYWAWNIGPFPITGP